MMLYFQHFDSSDTLVMC